MRVWYYRYTKFFFRKITCDLCGCVIGKRRIGAHSIWHAKRVEGSSKRPDTGFGCHKHITVTHVGQAGNLQVIEESGWVTNDLGPM